MNDLHQKMIEIGFTGLEARIYLGLLSRTMTTAGALAKHTNLKRSTVYTVLDSLIEKGLVSTTQIESVRHYQAENPQRIDEFLQREIEKIQQKQQELESIKPKLENLHKKSINQPKISIYEGEKGVRNLLAHDLDQKPHEVYVFGHYINEKDDIAEYTQRRISMEIPTKVIAPDSKYAVFAKGKDKKENRKSYIIESKYKFPASIHVYDQSISIFTLADNDPVGILIENDNICQTMKMLFHLFESTIES